MNAAAQEIFEKTMSRVPAKHRKLSFDQAHAAVQKKLKLMEAGEPFEKIVKPKGYLTFEAAVEAIRKVEACSGTVAMQKAADEHPELLTAYNKAGEAAALAATQTPSPRMGAKDVKRFELAVEHVMSRDKVSRNVAMGRARVEEAQLFAAYQRA